MTTTSAAGHGEFGGAVGELYPGGSDNHDLAFLAVFVELFCGIDRKEHRFRLVLERTVFFVIKPDHPIVVVGRQPLDEAPSNRHVFSSC